MRNKAKAAVVMGIPIAAVLALAGCGGGALAVQPAPSGPPPHLSISYAGTSGKVGHHLYAEPRAYCGETWSQAGTTHVGGTLPPGLGFDGSRIAGTPTQPGRWQVTVRFHAPECRGMTYPDQDVTVNFNIEGIAPRRVQ